MATAVEVVLRQQLIDRRRQLERAVSAGLVTLQLQTLIREVDAALARMDAGTYGFCEVCHDPIEPDRLLGDPLARFCMEHLTPAQARALESDLGLASRVQKTLLPDPHLRHGLWETAYHYAPAGVVSGDYCDLLPAANGDLYFILGDVAGKGIAASMLMVHLQAMFRSLIPLGLPLPELLERASRIFCQSTLPTHYATLVCGRAESSGQVEVCNAGHLPPLLVSAEGVETVDPTGLPLGAFCDEQFGSRRISVLPGQSILLFTDGLTESRDGAGRMYGNDRVGELVRGRQGSPQALIGACLEDLAAFRRDTPATDDLTILAIRRSETE